MNVAKKNKMIAASVAGLLAVGGMSVTTVASAEMGTGVACYGINACKGTGDCGGKGYSCAGKNACKGHGFINVDSADTCTKVKGGSLTPSEE